MGVIRPARSRAQSRPASSVELFTARLARIEQRKAQSRLFQSPSSPFFPLFGHLFSLSRPRSNFPRDVRAFPLLHCIASVGKSLGKEPGRCALQLLKKREREAPLSLQELVYLIGVPRF